MMMPIGIEDPNTLGRNRVCRVGVEDPKCTKLTHPVCALPYKIEP